jgi:hypothetical protein
VLATAAALLCAACGGSAAHPGPVVPKRTTARAVWLCRPGLERNPCQSSLTATVVGPRGVLGVSHASDARDPPIDCFYVYPTVSEQTTANANLDIDPQERAVAIAQASRFSQVCRVFAPVYRQLTLRTILAPGGISRADALRAYDGVASAFADYLARYNDGRGIVFIGHSQGATLLIRLLQQTVDRDRDLRARLVSALLMGGNVTVAEGRTVGGDFSHIPACASATQTGCVVAYSSFDQPPSALAFFGRTTSSLDPFAHPSAGVHVLCVNPAAPGGAGGRLLTYFPTRDVSALGFSTAQLGAVTTAWVEFPDEYTAHCVSGDGANWLEIKRPGGRADHRAAVTQLDGPNWGLHPYDVNLALGNLVNLVRSEARAYVAARRG